MANLKHSTRYRKIDSSGDMFRLLLTYPNLVERYGGVKSTWTHVVISPEDFNWLASKLPRGTGGLGWTDFYVGSRH
jgi:hypothetical protein